MTVNVNVRRQQGMDFVTGGSVMDPDSTHSLQRSDVNAKSMHDPRGQL